MLLNPLHDRSGMLSYNCNKPTRGFSNRNGSDGRNTGGHKEERRFAKCVLTLLNMCQYNTAPHAGKL